MSFAGQRPVDADDQRQFRVLTQKFQPLRQLSGVPAVKEFQMDSLSAFPVAEREVGKEYLLIAAVDKRCFADDLPGALFFGKQPVVEPDIFRDHR